MRRSVGAPALCLCALLGPATAARAELIYFASGRTLSIESHRIDGRSATLRLRGGGEVVCDAALIVKVEPDEVPWPVPVEPEAEDSAPPVVTPFAHLIDPLAERHGVDSALIRAVVETESGFAPGARSPKGAMGLMQLMPGTARQYAVADAYEPSANLDAGIRHLKLLLDRYDIRVALAAYNAGEAAVRRFGGVPPFRETREYVEKVLRRLDHYRQPGSRPREGAAPHDSRPSPGAPSS